MDTIKELAKQIVENVGGADNISSISHCSTRLRLYLKNEKLFNTEAIKKIDGVFDVSKATDQYQIIIGQTVGKVCDEILNSYKIESEENKNPAKKGDSGAKRVLGRFMELIAGCIAPIVPALTASGLIKVLLILLTMTHVMSDKGQTYYILNFAADVIFYFMPIFLAYTSAKKFKTDCILAMVMAGIMLHPNFVSLVSAGKSVHFIGLPVTLTSYAASVVPIILSVWVMSLVDKLADKVIPELFSNLFKPLLIVLIMTPVVLVVTGPLGAICGNGLSVIIQLLNSKAGWLAFLILCPFGPFIQMTGMHLALIPICLSSIASVGYDSLILVWFLCHTVSQGAAALAVFLKTKNSKLKQIAGPAAIAGLFGGISEPALYGVNLRLKKPLYAAMLGATVSGTFAGFVKLKCFAYGAPSLLALPAYISKTASSNFIFAVITAALAVVVTFVAVFVLGFDDTIFGEENKNISNKIEMTAEVEDTEIASPMTGAVVPMKEIKDDIFAKGALGQAIGIISNDGKCYSPIDGEVSSVFKTKHAIGLRSSSGAEVLIHVGIDTVNLNGKGFKTFIKQGDTVKQGDLILEYDKELLKSNNFDDTTIIVITNGQNFKKIETSENKTVNVGDKLITALV